MTKRIFNFLTTTVFCCSTMFMPASCAVSEDNPAPQQSSDAVTPDQLKQGVWTEFDEALVASGELTEEELAEMPSIGMMLEGDKAYFFTYTAEGADDLVEGKVSYNKAAGTGNITFPTIKDNPLSGQTVNFTATTNETLQFELTYGGETTTATFAWLCENLDNWGTEITDEDWKELMAYYQTIDEKAGPNGSIDWSDSEVKGLDEPLVWEEGTSSTRGNTRIATAIIEGVSAGLEIFSSLFEDDPMEEINAKLDAVLDKLDNVLANQQKMMAKLDEVNTRLKAIAQKLEKAEIVNMFNNRNENYYNPLKVRNTSYFDDAFKLYNDNKSNLSSVSSKLGEYAKAWVGNNEEYVSLTWQYIEYLNTVQHTDYGKGMANIYDGLTFDKYPWEHMGTGDRKSYRAYDMFMIAKSLFMINLYAAYGGLTDVQKTGIYNNYKNYKPQLKAFCEFKISNPDKFIVCQIPGAHFVMHKEIQKYNYLGANNKAPHPINFDTPDREAAYRPEWHEAGSIKIENPKELKSKLISAEEATAIYNYFKSAVYPNEKNISWTNMLVNGNDKAGGAVFSKNPTKTGEHLRLLLIHPEISNRCGVAFAGVGSPLIDINSTVGCDFSHDVLWNGWYTLGRVHILPQNGIYKWDYYFDTGEFYAAIVQERFK